MVKTATFESFIKNLRSTLEANLERIYAYDREETFPWDVVGALAPLGAWGMIFPKEYGGLGLTHTEYTQALEELGRIDSSTALTAESHNSLCGHTILMFGSEEQKRKYLPRMAKGETMGAWALTEPEAGSDAKSINNSTTIINNTNRIAIFVYASYDDLS